MGKSAKILYLIFCVVIILLVAIIMYISMDKTAMQSKLMVIENDNVQLVNEINHLQEEIIILQASIEEYKNGEKIDGFSGLPYVRPDFLDREWDQVIFETNNEEILVDSNEIIEAFKGSFYGIVQTENPYPGGFNMGHPSFIFHIISGDVTYTFYSLEHGYFMTEDMNTFYRTPRDYTQLAKAYLSKPNDYPDENLLSKLYHSGMIMGEKEFPFPVLNSSRIKSIVTSFISAAKIEVAPLSANSEYLEKFTFYYFGEKYFMTLYDKHIHLFSEDSSINYWYEVDAEDILKIFMNLRAG